MWTSKEPVTCSGRCLQAVALLSFQALHAELDGGWRCSSCRHGHARWATGLHPHCRPVHLIPCRIAMCCTAAFAGTVQSPYKPRNPNATQARHATVAAILQQALSRHSHNSASLSLSLRLFLPPLISPDVESPPLSRSLWGGSCAPSTSSPPSAPDLLFKLVQALHALHAR